MQESSPFYTILGEFYDEIFPLDCEMADFLSRSLPRGPALDIGCATGAMALSLARMGFTVQGIDLEPGMIATAQARARATGLPATFSVCDMRALAGTAAPGNLAAVWCMGNTLVHLDSLAETEALLSSIHQRLRPGGWLALQIINYDRVLDLGIHELPVRETDFLRFERKYALAGGRIDFRTRLLVKITDTAFDSSILLLPLRANALNSALQAAGFREIRLFSDFNNAPWSPAGYLTVALARA